MRALTAATFFAGVLFVASSASADDGVAPPPAAPITLSAPTAAPVAPLAPTYPSPPVNAPGYSPPYAVYSPPYAGAPAPYWMPIAPATERRSPALRATGVALFVVGGVTSLVGVVLFAAIGSTGCEDDGTGRRPCSISPGVARLVGGAGAVTGLVGVPLFVIGSQRVPAGTTTGKLVPELTVGVVNGSLRWSF